MAARFWVLGTGTWDASDTAHWAASSGGAPLASVPGSGDTVTFDALSGGGTVTVNTTVAVTSITAGAFTGTLDFAANNNNVTAATVSFTGTGTRTINMGSGTWTLTSTAGTTVFDNGTVTNETASFASAVIVIQGSTSSARTFSGGGKSFGSLSVEANALRGFLTIGGSNTFGSVSVAAGQNLYFGGSTTNVITSAFNWAGTSTSPISVRSNSDTNPATLSVGGASTINWGFLYRITKAGAGSITATNSLDGGGLTSVTITPPQSGGASINRRAIGVR